MISGSAQRNARGLANQLEARLLKLKHYRSHVPIRQLSELLTSEKYCRNVKWREKMTEK